MSKVIHYCKLIYLIIFNIRVLKYMNQIQQDFLQPQGQHDKVKLDLLIDTDVINGTKKVLEEEYIILFIHQYVKANNKYRKDYNEGKESLCLKLGVNNLHGWTISQKLPVNGFGWVKETSQFYDSVIVRYEEKDEGYFLKVDVQYPEKLHELYNDLLFLPEKK